MPYSKNSNYYSARDVFVALNGGKALNPDPYDKKTNSATFSYTYAGKTVKLYYDLNTVEREKAWIFFSKGKEGSSFTGTFSGGEKAMNISLIYSGKKAYISKSDVEFYFRKVWCEKSTPVSQTDTSLNLPLTQEQKIFVSMLGSCCSDNC